MICLSDNNLIELTDILSEYALPKFKVKEINKWLLNGYKFDEMTNIDKTTREKLKGEFSDIPIEILKSYTSVDGTIKLLYKLADGNLIEGVLMSYEYGNTLCISSQVGCRMGCVFCASTMNGLERNLTAAEMLGQVSVTNRFVGGNFSSRKITNVVLMGSGEPLDNYDNVVKFLELISSESSLNVSRRNISLSTCGLVPNIKRLADDNLGVTLTISLHNPFDDERKEIMPIAKSYSVKELIDAARYYFDKTGRRVVFEYTLIKGVNDTEKYAVELSKILKGFPNHINCIIYNEVKGKSLTPPTRKDGYRFCEMLEKLNMSATLRRQMGVDIEGACGQLKRRFEEGDEI
ncbi:MAG: 23S rRNA (adenine(2503)-C(2))-methyltransferase RlmN [Clostridia bacterium]